MTAPRDPHDPTDPTPARASGPAAGGDPAADAAPDARRGHDDRARADRRGELVAAALADDLSPDEADELARLRAADPTVDEELALLGAVVARTGALDGWQEVEPGDDLRRRVHAVADGPAPEERHAADAVADEHLAPVAPLPRRRRLLLTVVGAAACLAVGAGLGALATAPRDAVVEGPPGTLGAVEHLDFRDVPVGVDLDADLVAHTWGTETVLVVDGLPVGDAFSVVVVDDRGQEFSSGAFLGSEVPVDCRLNAAVLREHVASVEIRGADGEVVTAELPAVGA